MNKIFGIFVCLLLSTSYVFCKEGDILLQININGKPVVLIKEHKVPNEDEIKIPASVDEFGQFVNKNDKRFFNYFSSCFANQPDFYIGENGVLVEYDNNFKWYNEKGRSLSKSFYNVNCINGEKWYPNKDFIYPGKNKNIFIVFDLPIELDIQDQLDVENGWKKLEENMNLKDFKAIVERVNNKMFAKGIAQQLKFSNNSNCIFTRTINGGNNSVYFLPTKDIRVDYDTFCIKPTGKPNYRNYNRRMINLCTYMTYQIYFPCVEKEINYGKLLYRKDKNSEWQDVKLVSHVTNNWEKLAKGKGVITCNNTGFEVFNENGEIDTLKIHYEDSKNTNLNPERIQRNVQDLFNSLKNQFNNQ